MLSLGFPSSSHMESVSGSITRPYNDQIGVTFSDSEKPRDADFEAKIREIGLENVEFLSVSNGSKLTAKAFDLATDLPNLKVFRVNRPSPELAEAIEIFKPLLMYRPLLAIWVDDHRVDPEALDL